MKTRLLNFTMGILIGSVLLSACSSGGGGDAPAPTAPATPTGLAATVVSTSAINLTWTDASSNEDNFVVERGTDGVAFTAVTTTAANVTSYSDTGLATSTKYYYRVKATNSVGDSAYSNTADATTLSPAPPLVLAPRYSIAPNWNDYVSSSNTATTCAGTETGGYTACIHGGENLVVPVMGKTSCTGLTATDSLGAFAWTCDGSTNPASVVSKGLNSGKNLSDLIDFTTAAWKQNAVTVYDGGTAYNSTSAAVWWTNPIVQNNAGGNLSTAGTIYTVTSNASVSYVINASKVGLVMKPGFTVTVTTSAVISAVSQTFIWIEGSVDGGSAASDGVLLNNAKFSVLRNIAAKNSTFGVTINNSINNRMIGLRSANNAGYGINLTSSSNDNTLADVTASNAAAAGITFQGSRNALVNATVNNIGDVGIIINGFNNRVVAATSSNNANAGVAINGASNSFVMDLVSENSGSGRSIGGLFIQSDGNTIANFASGENAGTPAIQINSSNNYFTGILKVGSNISPCSVIGGTLPGLTNGTCAVNGSSDAAVSTGVGLSSSFVAKVTTNDTVNKDDVNGALDFFAIADWTSFENGYRGWGKNGSAFPNTDHQGMCSTGTCRIWDWNLKAADIVVKGVLSIPSGDDRILHKWLAVDQTACNTIPGALWNSNFPGTCFSQVLRNAVEITGDGIGNDNGLCESGETCLYTPNIGSYQGHGSLISAGTFTDGFISGVTLLKYSTNGY